MFVIKAGAYSGKAELSGAPLKGRLLALLTHKERPASDKHSSLLGTCVNYVRKKFHNIGP